ncbi:MAG: GMP synthase subunit A [Candidatus Thermoplasmatota archaeon]|nr:GMP synthase subunit A [Candidatus Thermoplasmatota archaeon]
MVRILVVDNGGQWTHREWRTLRDLGVDTKIFPNTAKFEEFENYGVDGLVLSGGAPRMGLQNNLGNCKEYLQKANFPILGICAGHQFMARFFGGNVKPSKIPEFGKVELQILSKDSLLFKDLPKKSIVWESHNDEVVELPPTFELLASSENCLIQAMQHKTKPLFGLQFHPEVKHTEFGEKIFSNFITICEE